MYAVSSLTRRISFLPEFRFLSLAPSAAGRCHAMAATTAKDAVAVAPDNPQVSLSVPEKNIRGYGEGPKPLPEELQRETQDLDPTAMPKRVVALHIGYVGTNYRGLQMTIDELQLSNPVKAVEDVVAFAIMKAGYMRKENFGYPTKVSWTRSSRTDKGVHSVATVVSLKMHCRDDSWEADPEGLEYATAINKHLPADIRVFSVQRVSNSYNCRAMCISRAYEYHVPAAVLGLRGHSSGGGANGDGRGEPERAADAEHDAEVMQRLRAALTCLTGERPFHNYTKRQRYIPSKNTPQRGVARKRGRGNPAPATVAAAQGSTAGSAAGSAAPAEAPAAATKPSGADSGEEECFGDDGDDPGADCGGGDAAPAAPLDSSWRTAEPWMNVDEATKAALLEEFDHRWAPFAFQVSWQPPQEGNERSKVFRAHWRRVYKLEAGDVEYLGPNSVPAVKIAVHGESFMFNMIRHLVGMSVAVARGALPLEFVEPSLCMSALCTVPLAPPESLVLSENEFRPFKQQPGSSLPPAVASSGDRLQLRDGGTAVRREFESGVLGAGLADLLDPAARNWREWTAALDHIAIDTEATGAWMQKYSVWAREVGERRAQRAADKAAEAAAAAVAAAAAAAEPAAASTAGAANGAQGA
eukprot:jgi/Ulvmu1/6520/UM003_0153.1